LSTWMRNVLRFYALKSQSSLYEDDIPCSGPCVSGFAYRQSYSVFSPTEFALTWIEVMVFRALLLIERVTSTNSEVFSNPSWCKPGWAENANKNLRNLQPDLREWFCDWRYANPLTNDPLHGTLRHMCRIAYRVTN